VTNSARRLLQSGNLFGLSIGSALAFRARRWGFRGCKALWDRRAGDGRKAPGSVVHRLAFRKPRCADDERRRARW
jgi:hypothetical protein